MFFSHWGENKSQHIRKNKCLLTSISVSTEFSNVNMVWLNRILISQDRLQHDALPVQQLYSGFQLQAVVLKTTVPFFFLLKKCQVRIVYGRSNALVPIQSPLNS